MSTAILQEPTLFDEFPPQILPDDSPRVRRADPITSHLAADRSQHSIPAVKDAVLSLLHEEGALPGSELNRLYQLRAERRGWPLPLHFDSPRKRAGELAVDGLVQILNGDAPRGTEREYALLVVTS